EGTDDNQGARSRHAERHDRREQTAGGWQWTGPLRLAARFSFPDVRPEVRRGELVDDMQAFDLARHRAPPAGGGGVDGPGLRALARSPGRPPRSAPHRWWEGPRSRGGSPQLAACARAP